MQEGWRKEERRRIIYLLKPIASAITWALVCDEGTRDVTVKATVKERSDCEGDGECWK